MVTVTAPPGDQNRLRSGPVGESVPRLEAVSQVTGRAQYVDDIMLPGMLQVAVKHGEHPNARLVSIDLSQAWRVPGVAAIITAADVPRNRFGYVNDQVVLAEGYVRYLGQPIAAVAAETLAAARTAAAAIRVQYEVLEPVFDPVQAMAPGSPLAREHGNVVVLGQYDHLRIRLGDVEAAFRQADLIVEDTFTTHMQEHAPIETHVGLAEVEADGRVAVHCTSQHLFITRKELAGVLQLPESRVRVAGGIVGGGFGAKSDLSMEPVVALLALKTGRPVKWRWTREEEFLFPTKRSPYVMYYKTGVKADGTITGRYVRTIQDTGAFCYKGTKAIVKHTVLARGPYRIPNFWLDGFVVYTNKTPTGALRGYGVPQVTFAFETQMDRIAAALGMDPLEIRLKNALQEGDLSATGFPLEAVAAAETLQAAARVYGWRPAPAGGAAGGAGASGSGGRPGAGAVRRGRGICATHMNTGLTGGATPSMAAIRVNTDGSVHLSVSSSELGQGVRTVLAQVAADVLGLQAADIAVGRADTAQAPMCAGSGASQATYMTGNAVKRAAEDVKARMLQVAAGVLATTPDQLELSGGRVWVRGASGRGLTLAQVGAAAAEQNVFLLGAGAFRLTKTVPLDADTGLGNPYEQLEYAATIADVAVDTDTGRVTVERVVFALDAGKVMNPMLAEGQIQGGLAMNLGWILGENMLPCHPSVQFMVRGFHDYSMPTAMDVPPVEMVFVEKPSPRGPWGAKGIGEITCTALTASVTNAIYDATGVMLRSLPADPETILRALREQGA